MRGGDWSSGVGGAVDALRAALPYPPYLAGIQGYAQIFTAISENDTLKRNPGVKRLVGTLLAGDRIAILMPWVAERMCLSRDSITCEILKQNCVSCRNQTTRENVNTALAIRWSFMSPLAGADAPACRRPFTNAEFPGGPVDAVMSRDARTSVLSEDSMHDPRRIGVVRMANVLADCIIHLAGGEKRCETARIKLKHVYTRPAYLAYLNLDWHLQRACRQHPRTFKQTMQVQCLAY